MDYFKVDNKIKIDDMYCHGFFPYKLEDIISTFGASKNNKWRISCHFNKNIHIIYNELVNVIFLYGNDDLIEDNLFDVSDYIYANINEENDELCDLTDNSDDESIFESDVEDIQSVKLFGVKTGNK
jgi:hypothetical protein